MFKPLLSILIATPLVASAAAHAQGFGDSHCFDRAAMAKGEIPTSTGPLEQVLNEEESAAFADRVWELRLRDKVWLKLNRRYAERLDPFVSENGSGTPRLRRGSRVHWLDAWAIRANQRHADRQERKTGSRIGHVSPSMQQLAREQATLRAVQGRGCNPHITYLGG